MSIIISMNDETYTPCTKCGRPMAYCKGQCCGQPQGCSCQEYGPMKAGCLREIEPSCPYQAVIPTLTVEDKSNLKDLADCFVHVSNINTTFYIDDKHRTIVTWAGPVEYDNYDLDANTLGLRGQFLIDKANGILAYYDKTGAYQEYSYGGDEENIITLDLSYDTETTNWGIGNEGPIYQDSESESGSYRYSMHTFEVPNPVFTNHDTGVTLTLEEAYELLETGADVRFDGIPFGFAYINENGSRRGSLESIALCDNIKLSVKSTQLDSYGDTYSYDGTAFPQIGGAMVSAPMGVSLTKEMKANGELNRFVLCTQGAYYEIVRYT